MLLNMDMIGRLRKEKVEVYGTRTSYGLRRLVSQENEGGSLFLDFHWEMRADSDHYPFLRKRQFPTGAAAAYGVAQRLPSPKRHGRQDQLGRHESPRGGAAGVPARLSIWPTPARSPASAIALTMKTPGRRRRSNGRSPRFPAGWECIGKKRRKRSMRLANPCRGRRRFAGGRRRAQGQAIASCNSRDTNWPAG